MPKGERFNVLSHLFGAALAVIGIFPLVSAGMAAKHTGQLTAFLIYGISQFAVFMSSTLYHYSGPERRTFFRRLDHAAIYLLIAGTYTPLAVVTLGGEEGWTLLATAWGLAGVGIVYVSQRSFDSGMGFQVTLCLAMGWMGAFGLDRLLTTLPLAGFVWLIAGGMFYTVGVIFFLLDHRLRYAHGVWHLFVLAGSASHYVTVLGYVGA